MHWQAARQIKHFQAISSFEALARVLKQLG